MEIWITAFDVFGYDPNGEFLNTNGSPFKEATQNKNFGELTPGIADTLISNMVMDNYELVCYQQPTIGQFLNKSTIRMP